MRYAARRALPVATAVLAVALTACGGGEPEQAGGGDTAAGEKPAGGEGATAADTAPSASAAATGSAGARDEQAGAPQQPEPAPADLANFSCSRGRDGVWSARGDITSSAGERSVYTLTVVTVADSEVVGEDTERFVLEPRGSTSFELPRVGRGAADACMPRLVRATR